jgi:hypothetical protein
VVFPDREHDGSTRFSSWKPVNLWYHKSGLCWTEFEHVSRMIFTCSIASRAEYNELLESDCELGGVRDISLG